MKTDSFLGSPLLPNNLNTMPTNDTIFIDYLKHLGATQEDAEATLKEVRVRLEHGARPYDVIRSMDLDADLLELL